MKLAWLVIVALAATTIGSQAQNACVSSLTVGTGTSAMTILPPTGLMQPFTLDLSALASVAEGLPVQLSIQRSGGALQFVANPVPIIANPRTPINNPTVDARVDTQDVLMLGDDMNQRNNIVRVPATHGLIVHVERVTMPKYFEYEQHTFRISIPGALKGAVVMASPQSHLPSGFVVNYATCIEDGVIELRVANLTADCIQPETTTFSFAVINATASRR